MRRRTGLLIEARRRPQPKLFIRQRPPSKGRSAPPEHMYNADYIYCCRSLPSTGKSSVHDTISSLINHSRFIQESKVLLQEQQQSFFCESTQQSLPTAIDSSPGTSHHPYCVMPSHYSRSQCRCVVWTLYYTRCGHYVDASSSRDCTASTHSPTEMGCEERDGYCMQPDCPASYSSRSSRRSRR